MTATRDLIVKNKMGVHARPAAMIVRIVNKCPCDVFVEKDDEQVNAKSIMGLMMLAAGHGSKLRFIVADAAHSSLLDDLEDLFERRFEEA